MSGRGVGRVLLGLSVCGLGLVACGEVPSEAPAGEAATAPSEPSGPDVVAAHSHGEVSLRRVEERLGGARRTDDFAPADLVDTYLRAAQDVVVEHHVLHLIEDLVAALRERGDYTRLHRAAVLEAYLREHGGDLAEAGEDEARTFYDEHEERFHRPSRRLAWHIFRRARDPAATEETRELLLDLRRRALAGEPFGQLARQHSDSETRKAGGRLGWIERGHLSRRLEDVLFALAAGEVSEPLPVRGGAVIFHVSEAEADKTVPFIDVRARILEVLRDRARRELIAEAAADLEPPAGSLILEPSALDQILGGGDDEAVVLEVGDSRWTVAAFKAMLTEQLAGAPAWAATLPREAYRQRLQDQLLYMDLVSSGWAGSPERAPAIEGRLLREGTPPLIDDLMAQRMLERVDAAADLESFYRDNRYLYQSSLRLKLQNLSVPAGVGAQQMMVRMEELHERLKAGAVSFEEAALELGAELEDVGWIDFQQLMVFAPKVRTYLLDLEAAGYTVPFNQGDRLSLAWVQEWENPQPLTYEAVKDRVREDYLERFQQRLYQEVAAEILAEQDFRFFEQAVRRALNLAEPTPTQG